jgi:site-specific DNA-adenine methylase
MLKPFFKYYGGKYRIAPKYPSPITRTIIEPFAGSAGYSMRYPHLKIRLYDVNDRIVSLWSYLITVKESEILSLPEKFEDVRDLKVSQEAKYLIGFWINAGVAEPCNKPSSWMRSGLKPQCFWGSHNKLRIASQLRHIRHWKIENKSFEKIDNEYATWFIDPPYSNNAGRHYTHNEIKYDRLANFCMFRFGQVIVCENAGANWLPFQSFITSAKATPGKYRTGKSDEVVFTITNPGLTRPLLRNS